MEMNDKGNKDRDKEKVSIESDLEKSLEFDTSKLSKAQLKDLCDSLIEEHGKLIEECESAKQKSIKHEKMATKANDLDVAYQRIQADFESFKRRNASIESASKEKAEIAAALVFAPIYDNLLRAVSADCDRSGVEQIAKQFDTALRSLGVEHIEALGKKFDLDFHDAVTTMSVDSKEKDETVLHVVAEGYTYNGKVIKHAQVVVGKFE